MDIKLTDERQDIRGTRSDRVPPRIANRKHRAAIYSNGIFSVDGIPTSVESGSESTRRQEWGAMKLLTFISRHPISVPYCAVTVTIGLILQGWLHV